MAGANVLLENGMSNLKMLAVLSVYGRAVHQLVIVGELLVDELSFQRVVHL
jgi:hypothetical protein